MSYKSILDDISIEVSRAVEKYQPFHSLHEGFAVLQEEVELF